jgi:hypothetical protein
MTHRWDYRSSPYVRMGFWLLLVLAGFALTWAGKTEVKVYTRAEGELAVDAKQGKVFRAELPESDLTKVQVGMPASIGWTAYPKAQYGLSQGRVWKITVADQSAVVLVALDSPVLTTNTQIQPLQAGLSGSVQIALDQKRALEMLWDWIKGR